MLQGDVPRHVGAEGEGIPKTALRQVSFSKRAFVERTLSQVAPVFLHSPCRGENFLELLELSARKEGVGLRDLSCTFGKY
ncbi:unnamed protein product [Prunus armeniaca]|uniref:Uncharacterized protein n=1 Tax=Prunus armeniaca TaxID=36596 RepID=A0A6J5W0G2_PRUAR|nr:unnamed protein product [Prunus armeniaca]